MSTYQFDILCCDEPVEPESGQYPTTQPQVKFDYLELSIEAVIPEKWLCHVVGSVFQLAERND